MLLTPANWSVLPNFWALSLALAISPVRPLKPWMTVPATLWATPLMTPSLPAKPAEKPPPSLPPSVLPTVSDAEPNADSMLLPTFFMLGTICT